MNRTAIFILALASATPAAAQRAFPPDSAVRAMLAPRLAVLPDGGRNGEGIVVGLLEPGGTMRIIAVGVAPDRVFEIGSITKVFTASLLADMVARGSRSLPRMTRRFS